MVYSVVSHIQSNTSAPISLLWYSVAPNNLSIEDLTPTLIPRHFGAGAVMDSAELVEALSDLEVAGGNQVSGREHAMNTLCCINFACLRVYDWHCTAVVSQNSDHICSSVFYTTHSVFKQVVAERA